jgi:hypothetical protein
MVRKRTTEYPFAGRPPKPVAEKVGRPVRALVTVAVQKAMMEFARLHGIPQPPRGSVASDAVRLAIYRSLIQDGLMTPELMQDETWTSLREKGLV